MAVEGYPARNAHGVVHKRNLPQSVMSPIPDLRSGLEDVPSSPFQGNPIYANYVLSNSLAVFVFFCCRFI